MGPVRRRLFTIAWVLSFLLFLVTMVLWAGGFPVAVGIGNRRAMVAIEIRDCVNFSLWTYHLDEKESSTIKSPFIRVSGSGLLMLASDVVATSGYDGDMFSLARSRYFDGPGSASVVQYFVACPFWFLACIFSVLPATWVVLRRARSRRIARRLCPTCGYNLTGNVSGVCPECGAAIPKIPAV